MELDREHVYQGPRRPDTFHGYLNSPFIPSEFFSYESHVT